MRFTRFALAAGLGALSAAGACTESICAIHPDDALCQLATYRDFTTTFTADCAPEQTDAGDGARFRVRLSVESPSGGPQKLAPLGKGLPDVYIQTAGDPIQVPESQLQLAPDQLGFQVTLPKDRLGTGPLKLRIVLSSANPALQSEALASCTATLSTPQEVALSESPRGPLITGIVGMQLGTFVGAERQLLLSEQFIGAMGFPERWAELYRPDNTGRIARDGSVPTWSKTVQKQLQESGQALFAATQDVLLSYDVYLGGPKKQLSMFSLKPLTSSRYSVLAEMDATLGQSRTALAAAADDQLMLLGSTGNVSWFRVSAVPMPGYVFLGETAMISGEPVLAARAERNPLFPSGPCFGVAWDKSRGTGLLLKITRTDAGKSAELTPVALPPAVQAGFSQALAGETVAAAALGDLNHDGSEDLLIATSGRRFLWAAQKSQAHFAAVPEPEVAFREVEELKLTPPPGTITALAIGDVTGDGKVDLGVVAAQRAYVYTGL